MRVPRFGRRLFLALAFCALSAAGTPAAAQYFGRNKVQYHTPKFEVLKTTTFDVYFYPEERVGAQAAARLAERWNARLSRIFDYQLTGRQPLILYASHLDFEQTNIISGELGEGTGGVTEPLRRRIILPLAGPLSDTDHVIGHELVHAFQFDMTSSPGQTSGEFALNRLPLWFVEGMAEYLTLGPVDANTAMWLRDAARRETLPAVDRLDDPAYFPYRWGHAFWAYVCGRWGDRVAARMLGAALSAGGVNTAIESVLGTTAKDLSTDWHAAIHQAYAPALASALPPEDAGRLVVQGKELAGALNVGPSLSPDGRWMTFLSDRDFVSIDLYLAEVATGRIARRLTSTATNPHYSSLQFVYSAGSWDRAGRRIAVGAVTGGHPAVAIFDVDSGRKERDIPVSEVDELFNPTWAPDGHAIAFTGMTQGVTDLFVYDLDGSTLRRLTDDLYADLQPAWSPDGRRIAFATDRFTTDAGTLAIGTYRLALVDPASGAIEPVPAFPAGKHINPQWSPDGQALVFIADPDGVPNLYRAELATGAITQLTRIVTGVSGITASSPGVSVASVSGTVAFTVYDGGKYHIYTRAAAATTGTVLQPIVPTAAALPPLERTAEEVAPLLSNATLGLPEPSTFAIEPYTSTLMLEGVAQPMVGVGVSRFGTTLGGGLSLYFSDMLENHLLGTAIQLNSGIGGTYSVNDLGAQVSYLDRERRWSRGVTAGQFPYLSGGFQYWVEQIPNGDVIETDQLIVFRQTERSAAGVLAYPFDRARRVEFQGGIGHISFEQVVRTTSYSLYTGAIYQDSTETREVAESLTMATSSAAYVFDTTSFGATSPVHGQRYRFEASPTLGSVDFTGVLADYRRYFMPVPFYTLGVRLMHYGRYGPGGEDPRLYPLYLGYPGLVRGYDVTGYDAADCGPISTSTCPAIDRLLGSRLLIGNVELRFPILRPLGLSRGMYGPLPTEVAIFADAGTAWSRGQSPSFAGDASGGIASAGVTLRVNLFGVAVGEFDVVRPFQRPAQGWVFTFNLLPGW